MNKKHKERENETSFKEYYYRVGWCSEFIPIIVEREVYTIASFSANIDSGLPPLGPGWERVIVWKRMDGFTLYSYANSTQRKFLFHGDPGPNGAFLFWLKNDDQPYNLSEVGCYVFPSGEEDTKQIFGLYEERIKLSLGVEGQGVIHPDSSSYPGRKLGWNPLPLCADGECMGWRSESIDPCINIEANEITLTAEPCSPAWVFSHWKYYQPSEENPEGENPESGTWIEIPSIGDSISWYMNWWGYLDPYHYHVPWGTTTFQVRAVFEQLKALILIGEAYGISGNETIAGPSLEGLCYLVDSINALESEPEESATTDIEILTCIRDYNIFVFQGEAYCAEELEGEEEQVVGIEVDHIWNPDTGMYTYTIVPEEIAQYNIGHEYLFVYLLSCYQGRILDDWHNAFNSSCSLGFWDRVFATPAKEFDAKFWEFVSMDLDIYNSAIISANIINEEAEFQEEPYILYPLIPIVNGNAHLK